MVELDRICYTHATMWLDPYDVNEAFVELLPQNLLSDTFDNVSNLNIKDPCVSQTKGRKRKDSNNAPRAWR